MSRLLYLAGVTKSFMEFLFPPNLCFLYNSNLYITGMYEFAKTGQLLPILVGTPMTDPSGSGQEVPILGAERDRNTAKIIPLGGTMEDPEGAGKICNVIL